MRYSLTVYVCDSGGVYNCDRPVTRRHHDMIPTRRHAPLLRSNLRPVGPAEHDGVPGRGEDEPSALSGRVKPELAYGLDGRCRSLHPADWLHVGMNGLTAAHVSSPNQSTLPVYRSNKRSYGRGEA